jgi:hypothetical protein
MRENMAKFIIGDSVRIAEPALLAVRPGSVAEVVGISEEGGRHGSYLDAFPRGVVYMVEFEDGSPAELQEAHLIPLASNEGSR